MMAIAFLVGTWITARRMAEEGLDPDLATTLLIYTMLGGIFGSKLYYAVDVSLRSGAPFTTLFFARDGITWYGGLLMGSLVGAIGCRIHRLPVKTVADCCAVAAAVGQALVRVAASCWATLRQAHTLPWRSPSAGLAATTETVTPPSLRGGWLLLVASPLGLRRRVRFCSADLGQTAPGSDRDRERAESKWRSAHRAAGSAGR